MNTISQKIWNPDTGITEIDTPWQTLGASEIESIKKIWAEQQERMKGTRQLTEFTERSSREWAIETGILENLYQIDRGITQTLIERGFQAEFLTSGSTNKPTSYVINLLRAQQDALEGVFDFVSQRRELSSSYIKELHAALVRSQDHTDAQDSHGNLIEIPLIKGDWKTQPNYPTRKGVNSHTARPSRLPRKWIDWSQCTKRTCGTEWLPKLKQLGCTTGSPRFIHSRMGTGAFAAPSLHWFWCVPDFSH